jgi:purine-nucleoside phosphorylase
MAVADLIRDRGLLPAVQKAADVLLSGDPQRVEALMDRWLKQSSEYAEV